MKTKLMFAVLCVGGLALLASPAWAQPRGRGGPDDGPKAAADPAAREQALELQVRELELQIKRLQEAVAGSESKPQPKPQADDGGRRGPAPARGMREQPARPQARPGREGPTAYAGRFEGPATQWLPRGGFMARRPAYGRNEQPALAAPQTALSQIRQLLDEARTMIARAEQLLARQAAPRGQADGGFAQRTPGFRQDGRDGLQGPGGRDRFAAPPAPAGRDGRMGPGTMRFQPQGDGRQGPQGPMNGGPWQREGGRGQGFRGDGFGPGGPGRDGSFGPPPGPRGEGRFGPPRSNED